jgi:hypothetical protein
MKNRGSQLLIHRCQCPLEGRRSESGCSSQSPAPLAEPGALEELLLRMVPLCVSSLKEWGRSTGLVEPFPGCGRVAVSPPATVKRPQRSEDKQPWIVKG